MSDKPTHQPAATTVRQVWRRRRQGPQPTRSRAAIDPQADSGRAAASVVPQPCLHHRHDHRWLLASFRALYPAVDHLGAKGFRDRSDGAGLVRAHPGPMPGSGLTRSGATFSAA